MSTELGNQLRAKTNETITTDEKGHNKETLTDKTKDNTVSNVTSSAIFETNLSLEIKGVEEFDKDKDVIADEEQQDKKIESQSKEEIQSSRDTHQEELKKTAEDKDYFINTSKVSLKWLLMTTFLSAILGAMFGCFVMYRFNQPELVKVHDSHIQFQVQKAVHDLNSQMESWMKVLEVNQTSCLSQAQETAHDLKSHMESELKVLEGEQTSCKSRVQEFDTTLNRFQIEVKQCQDKRMEEKELYDLQHAETAKTLNELKNTVTNLSNQMEVCHMKVNETLNKTRDDVYKLRNETEDRIGDLKFQHLLQNAGVMNFGTWAPFVLIMAAIEFVTVFFLCKLLARPKNIVSPADPTTTARHVNIMENHENNSITEDLSVICFDQRAEEKVLRWSEMLLQRAQLDGRVSPKLHVVTSGNQGKTIRCRAALVFVFPDERNMILEHERLHMADKRRETVKSLSERDTDVHLIIYDDKEDRQSDNQFYNHRLRQIEEHETLKRLQSEHRVLSFNTELSDFQIQHIANNLQLRFR